MGNSIKRFLSLALALVMVFTMLPGVVFAADEAVAKVGSTEYSTIDEAIANWTAGTTLTLLDNVTLSDVITIKSTEHHILNLGTYTMTAAEGKNAIEIVAYGTGSAEQYAITISADATNPGGINAGNKSIVYYDYSKGTATGEDRPIIKINGGVFTGNTSAFGSGGIYFKGTAARKCATLNISGGTFNCSILGTGKSKLSISGGTFNYSVSSQGDSTCYRLISGGTFKTLGFMTADSNNTKFWIGTSMGNSNVGTYIDDDGYLVVGGPVVSEAGETFEASSDNYGGFSSYLQYSSAATNGLYYTEVEEALADNNKTTGKVTVYTDELDLTEINYKGTIVIPEGNDITITYTADNVPKVVDSEGNQVTLNGEADENGVVVGTNFVCEAQIGSEKYKTLKEAIDDAKSGDTVTVIADATLTTSNTVPAGVTINSNESVVITTDVHHAFILSDGAKLDGLTIKQPTVSGVANTIYMNSNSQVVNCTVTGEYGVDGNDTTCRAIEVAPGAANVTITGNTFENLRQPAYVNNNCTGTIANNYADGTKGWVICSDSDMTITGNTFGENAVDICIIKSGSIDNYAGKTAELSANNNGAFVENQVESVIIDDGNLTAKDYKTLAGALAAAQDGDTITLIADIELTETVVFDKEGTFVIEGNGYTISQAEGYTDKVNGLFMLGDTVSGDTEAAKRNYTFNNVVFDGIEGWSVIRSQGVTLTMDGCTIQNCNNTLGQALLRLDYTEATIKNTTIKNNTALMGILHNYNADPSLTTLTIEECVIEGNSFNGTAAVYYVTGSGCEITKSEFVDNTVNCNNNGAMIYLGFQEDCAVTGCLFEGNDVIDASTSSRVAGAIFFGYEADISGNAFVNNTATNASGTSLGQVCASTYYDCDINLNGNYWNDGDTPVLGKDYTLQHQTGAADFILDNYYTSYDIDEDGNVVLDDENKEEATYVAEIVGRTGKYTSLQAALDAISTTAGDHTILIEGEFDEVTDFRQANGVNITIDGQNKTTYTGTIKFHGNALEDGKLTIKNIDFTTDNISHDFISSVITNYYPSDLLIQDCSFTGTGDINAEGYGVVAVRLKSANNVLIKDCTGSGLHSFLQNTAGWNLAVEDITVTDSLGGFAFGTVQTVSIKNVDLDVRDMGIRLDAAYNITAAIEASDIKAFIPVVVRKATASEYNVVFTGTNNFTETNTDGYWCVIGTSEYKANGELPTPATGKVYVALNGAGLDKTGVYGAYSAVEKESFVASVGEGKDYATIKEAVAAANAKEYASVTLNIYGVQEMDYAAMFNTTTIVSLVGMTEDAEIVLKNRPDHTADTYVNPSVAAGAPTGFSFPANGNTYVEGSEFYVSDIKITNNKDIPYKSGHNFRTGFYMYCVVENASYTNVDFDGGVLVEKNGSFVGCTFTEDNVGGASSGMYCLFIDQEYSKADSKAKVIIDECEFRPASTAYGAVKVANNKGDTTIEITDSIFEAVPNKPAINADENITAIITGNTFIDCKKGSYKADQPGTVNGVEVTGEDMTAVIAETNKVTGRGDINGDGELTNADVVILARYLVDLVELTEDQLYYADVNADGQIRNSDLVIMVRRIVEAEK